MNELGIGMFLGNKPVSTFKNGNFVFGNPKTILDTDAQAFIDATGITDATTISAIDTFVVQLKQYSLWDKMQAIYPFVGGTADTCKYNLVNPQDSDAAHRMTFPAGGTFDADGFKTNGTTTYGNANILGSDIGSLNDVHASVFATDLTQEDGQDFGARDVTWWLGGNMRSLSNLYNGRAFNSTISNKSHSGTPTRGGLTVSRLASSEYTVSWDTTHNFEVIASTGRPAYNMYIGGYNDFGTFSAGQARTYQMYTMGYGLTTYEVEILNGLEYDFNDTLSR